MVSELDIPYWFFDAAGVRKRNLLAEYLADTVTYQDVLDQYERVYGVVRKKVRKNRIIPL